MPAAGATGAARADQRGGSLRAGRETVDAVRGNGRPARAFVLLLGMGLRSFSMSPAFVPSMKDLASHVTIPNARELLRHVLRMKTTTRIKHFMRDQLKQIAPNLSLLDSE